MAIKTLGSSQQIRVSRESGNTKLIFLGLRTTKSTHSLLMNELKVMIVIFRSYICFFIDLNRSKQ